MKYFILLLFFSQLSFAQNACDYELIVPYTAVQVIDSQQVIQLDITVRRERTSSSNRCKEYQIYFGKGLSNSYQRKAFSLSFNSLNYNLHRTINLNGILKDYGDALNTNEYISSTTPQHEATYTQRIYLSIPSLSAQDSPKSNSYYDIVQVSLYANESNTGNFRIQDTKNLFVGLNVNKKIDVSLVDEGGAFDASATSKVLDFGILAQNAERAADLRVVSNTSYQIKVSSTNNGVLKHSNENRSIAYSLRSNGTQVGLNSSAGFPVLIGTGDATDSAGDKYNLRIQIAGNPQGLPSGQYGDVITITAIAN